MSVLLLIFAFFWLDSFPSRERVAWPHIAWLAGMLLLVGGAIVLERGWP